MNEFDFLAKGKLLPDISYQTNPPEEIVHPRITYIDNVPHVYSKPNHIALDDFLRKLAANEIPHVGAMRSNGKQTSITFSKRDKLVISARLEAILDTLRGH